MDLETLATVLATVIAVALLVGLRRLDRTAEDDVTAVVGTLLGSRDGTGREGLEPEAAVRWRVELVTPRETSHRPASDSGHERGTLPDRRVAHA